MTVHFFQPVRLMLLGASLAAAHAAAVAHSARLYANGGVGVASLGAHALRIALLAPVLFAVVLRCGAGLLTVLPAFAATEGVILAVVARRP